MRKREGLAVEQRSVIRPGGTIRNCNTLRTTSMGNSLKLKISQKLNNSGSQKGNNGKYDLQSDRISNKENERDAGNVSIVSNRSRDMLESYRASRNTHNLHRNDIFKYIRPPSNEQKAFKSRSKNSTGTKSMMCDPSVGEQIRLRLNQSCSDDMSAPKIAKKIDFNGNTAGKKPSNQTLLSKLSKLVSCLPEQKRQSQQTSFPGHPKIYSLVEPERKPSQKIHKKPSSKDFSNVFHHRNRSNSRSGQDSVRITVEDSEDGSAYLHSDTSGKIGEENKIKLNESDIFEFRYNIENEDTKKNCYQELSNFTNEENTRLPETSDKGLAYLDDCQTLNQPTRFSKIKNMDSMKTIKEVEEREEAMGYTSNKQSQNSNYKHGSFQNLIEKYYQEKEGIVIVGSENKSLDNPLSSRIDREEKRRQEEFRLQECGIHFEVYSTSSMASHQKEGAKKVKEEAYYNEQVPQIEIPKLRLGGVTQKTYPTNQLLSMSGSDSCPQEASELKYCHERSRSYSNYSREEKLDFELERVLKSIDRDTIRVRQESQSRQLGRGSNHNIDSISNPKLLRQIVKELEISNQEREAEVISLNMHVQDLSRLARVLVRKIKSNTTSAYASGHQ